MNILGTEYIPEISAAIEFLLSSKSTKSVPKSLLRNNTTISANVSLGSEIYRISAASCGEQFLLTATDARGKDVTALYQNALSHCPEQDAAENFDGKDNSLPLRFCWYRKPEDQDAIGDISGRTNRLIRTKAFRAHLNQYIRTFQPESINCRKRYQARINHTGKFEVICPGISGDILLSETEEKLFLYICFLNIAEFWADIEKIRNLHHENKPLLIRNFLEHLDESTDISGLIARTNKLQRQVIILTTPLGEKEKRNGSVNVMSENGYYK